MAVGAGNKLGRARATDAFLPFVCPEAVSAAPMRSTLLATPAVCEGRAGMIERIIVLIMASFCHVDEWPPERITANPIIVHGEGGIGKSTVAMKVMLDRTIRKLFDDQRTFVRCDGIKTRDTLLDHLVAELDVHLGGQVPQAALIAHLRANKAILVLDNFEDLCPNGPATGVEDLLAAMAESSQLILTKRGTPDLQLARLKSVSVEKLDASTSRKAFLAYVDNAGGHADKGPAFDALLDRLDGYPLAISLVGRAMVSGITTSQLLLQYDRLAKSYGHANDRISSVVASIRLSLESKLMLETPGARETCFLLSLLPDGAHQDLISAALMESPESALEPEATAPSEREAMASTPYRRLKDKVCRLLRRQRSAPARSPIPVGTRFPLPLLEPRTDPEAGFKAFAVRSALARSGLASTSVDSELLRMVVPLREHFRDNSGLDAATKAKVAQAASDYFCNLVQDVEQRRCSAQVFALQDQRLLTTQLGNIEASLGRDLESDALPLVMQALRALIDLIDFSCNTTCFVPSMAWPALEIAGTHQLHRLQVQCSQTFAELLYARGSLAEAAGLLKSALDISRSKGYWADEAHSLRALGWTSWWYTDPDTAVGSATKALKIFLSIGDMDGQAACWLDLARAQVATGKSDEAVKSAAEGLTIFRTLGDKTGEAWCLRNLGRAEFNKGNLSAAAAFSNEALSIFRSFHNLNGEAWCLLDLARAQWERGEADAASTASNNALAIFRRISNRNGEAWCLSDLGRASLARGDLDAAAASTTKALGIFNDIGNKKGEARCRVELAVHALVKTGTDPSLLVPGFGPIQSPAAIRLAGF